MNVMQSRFARPTSSFVDEALDGLGGARESGAEIAQRRQRGVDGGRFVGRGNVGEKRRSDADWEDVERFVENEDAIYGSGRR